MAVTIYWPLARTARGLEYLGQLPENWPLAHYKDRTFYVMRTDALDRFGTRLEHRYTRSQITAMLEAAGFEKSVFPTPHRIGARLPSGDEWTCAG